MDKTEKTDDILNDPLNYLNMREMTVFQKSGLSVEDWLQKTFGLSAKQFIQKARNGLPPLETASKPQQQFGDLSRLKNVVENMQKKSKKTDLSTKNNLKERRSCTINSQCGKVIITELNRPLRKIETDEHKHSGGCPNMENYFCIDFAISQGWNGFSCRKCPIFEAYKKSKPSVSAV